MLSGEMPLQMLLGWEAPRYIVLLYTNEKDETDKPKFILNHCYIKKHQLLLHIAPSVPPFCVHHCHKHCSVWVLSSHCWEHLQGFSCCLGDSKGEGNMWKGKPVTWLQHWEEWCPDHPLQSAEVNRGTVTWFRRAQAEYSALFLTSALLTEKGVKECISLQSFVVNEIHAGDCSQLLIVYS